MWDDTELTSFIVTKHSWKGKYKRIFAIGAQGISTYNPSSLEITNQWNFKEVVSLKPVNRPGGCPGEFVLNLRLGKKSDSLRFSSEYTPSLLTEALRFRESFANDSPEYKRINAQKYSWNGGKTPCNLKLCDFGLQQIYSGTGAPVADYFYKDINELIKVSDVRNGVIISYGPNRRLHLFAVDSDLDELFARLNQLALENVSVPIVVSHESIDLRRFYENRFGKLESDSASTSLVEFSVNKHSIRRQEPVKRLMCLSETRILERDPQSYAIVTSRPFSQIHCLVRNPDDSQTFLIEYISGEGRSYASPERDDALTSLLDGARATGNEFAHVRSRPTSRGLRLSPFGFALDEEAESQQVRILASGVPQYKFGDALERFNCNIPFSGLTYSVTQEGLFSENKEKLILSCLSAIIDGAATDLDAFGWESLFHALRRLFASKAGFAAFTCVPGLREKLGSRVVNALKLKEPAVTHAALDCLCALMQPVHANYELRREQANKASLLSSPNFLEFLLDVATQHVARNTGALIVSSTLEFLTYALCDPYCETTTGEQFDALLEQVAARGRAFYQLFGHSSTTVVKGAGLIMKALIEESDEATSLRMQELALTEGALLRHLHTALFTVSRDIRLLTQRQLSRRLVSLWVSGNSAAYSLLRRILPCGLVNSLDSKEKAPDDGDEFLLVRNNLNVAQVEATLKSNALVENLNQLHRAIDKRVEDFLQHWRLRENYRSFDKSESEEKIRKPITLRRRRKRVKCNANWRLFYHWCTIDHCKPDLLWNHKTREELREALESELRALETDRELVGVSRTAWNHEEFEVNYLSLSNEIKVGDYYLRILLDEGDTPVSNPRTFFFEVYHRFLLTNEVELRCLCLKALTLVYSRFSAEIGPFADTKYVLAALERCSDFSERDGLISFLEKLVLHKENVKEIIRSNSFKYLIDLACLAHLHTDRAHIPAQMNVIEASPDMAREDSKEWYYSTKDKNRHGPVGFRELRDMYKDGLVDEKTRCWAQGADQWRPLRSIPQLRWSFCASGVRHLNDTELAIAILNILIKICEYFPARNFDDCIILPIAKIKAILTDPSILPHIVQLLLTFDPTIVERTSALLTLLMQDNAAVSRLYLTGAFYFVLMYTGSNLLTVAKFLHSTHSKQSFKSNKKSSGVERGCDSSFLESVLPEAAILYLEHYGPEKYAEIFLGNYDTPEIIWNAEMRRYMIEKLAGHVADFTPRLFSNTKAVYQFCPIAPVFYSQLESELFCHVYYLKHLCDSVRFPDWPIREPVAFLKACLNAWADEVEKKPALMTVDEALQLLQIDCQNFMARDESTLRRAYFRLAQKFHPDKNPEGREMFEAVNRAYELLCVYSQKRKDLPDEDRVFLCIKAQSIVYARYGRELAPYKYAGYDPLIKTARLESEKEKLFPKAPLLEAATELCYLTLVRAPLNAEQLRREDGLEVLNVALSRCASVVGASSGESDSAVLVCINILRCFSTACQFEACGETLARMTGLYSDLVRLLRYEHLRELGSAACECVCSLSTRPESQTGLFEAGLLWCLLPNFFRYDFTMDESGIQKAQELHEQESMNLLARLSCEACACLAGLREQHPRNERVLAALGTLLTSRFCYLLQNRSVDEVLKTLNCNCETPYLIWDNHTRAELLEFIGKKGATNTTNAESDIEDFKFSALEKELVIGDVYVRIFNEQPTYCLENPEEFVVSLLNYVDDEVQYLHSSAVVSCLASEPTGIRTTENRKLDERINTKIERLCSALKALRHVLHFNKDLEELCIGHFRFLFGALRLLKNAEIQHSALDVIILALSNRRCVTDVAERELLAWPLLCLHFLPRSTPIVCSVLLSLLADSRIVRELLDKGGGIYLLAILCGTDRPFEERVAAAEVLAKAQSDKLHGPLWNRFLLKFLPPIFLDVVRDSAPTCIRMLDVSTENPELVWNDEIRLKVVENIDVIKSSIVTAHLADPSFTWIPPETFARLYEEAFSGELIVGGVFLRLYVTSPSWVVRNPRRFAADLIEAVLNETTIHNTVPNQQKLDLLTKSLVALLKIQPNLAELICSQGYAAQVVEKLKFKDDALCGSLLLIVQQMVQNQFCVECLAKSENFLTSLKVAVELRTDLLSVSANLIRLLYEIGWGDATLIRRTLDTGFLTFLLDLLSADSAVPAVRAEIATAIQKMTENHHFTDQVSVILAHSETWKEYKDQKHELFLPEAFGQGRIAGSAGMAGYLTQGLPQNRPSHYVPPP